MGSEIIPFMPDWPILRHLTWREAHMFELGLWPGISIALAVMVDDTALALALISGVRRRMQSDDQKDDSDDLISGYIRDAWYFGMGALAGVLIGFALVAVGANL